MLHRTKISRDEYESRVLLKLKQVLGDYEIIHKGSRILIEDVRLDKSGFPHEIHILFREETRPECLFGFRIDAAEDRSRLTEDPIILSPLKGYWGTGDLGWHNHLNPIRGSD